MATFLSDGSPNTLATWRKIAVALRGEDSPPVVFFDEKIAEQGEDAEVIQHESQMLYLIASM